MSETVGNDEIDLEAHAEIMRDIREEHEGEDVTGPGLFEEEDEEFHILDEKPGLEKYCENGRIGKEYGP